MKRGCGVNGGGPVRCPSRRPPDVGPPCGWIRFGRRVGQVYLPHRLAWLQLLLLHPGEQLAVGAGQLLVRPDVHAVHCERARQRGCDDVAGGAYRTGHREADLDVHGVAWRAQILRERRPGRVDPLGVQGRCDGGQSAVEQRLDGVDRYGVAHDGGVVLSVLRQLEIGHGASVGAAGGSRQGIWSRHRARPVGGVILGSRSAVGRRRFR